MAASSLYSTFTSSPPRRSSDTSTMISEGDSAPLMTDMQSAPLNRSPHFTRFLSDFTLGFSDGLTVPFALTAGLSSLGSTGTVITAGLAELCAGSISMGIGGYLAALDELPSPGPASETTAAEEGRAEERKRLLGRDALIRETRTKRSVEEEEEEEEEEEKLRQIEREVAILRHLQPLALSEGATAAILADLRREPGGVLRAVAGLETAATRDAADEKLTISPVMSGLSISLGYVVGGIIPLVPYFFLAEVGAALRWSIGMCLLALYLFGSGKCWFFRGEGSTWQRCTFEGLQMMVLGGLAAASAIVCVELLDGTGGGD